MKTREEKISHLRQLIAIRTEDAACYREQGQTSLAELTEKWLIDWRDELTELEMGR